MYIETPFISSHIGLMYIEEPYISSHIGPMYIETPYISSHMGPMYIETHFVSSHMAPLYIEAADISSNAWYKLCILVDIFPKDSRNSLYTSQDPYIVIILVSAENNFSLKYVVAKGSGILTAFWDNNIETHYISSHVGPMYIETLYIRVEGKNK